MSAVLNFQPQLRETNCYNCGVRFGMEPSFYEDRVRDHKTLYCPNGHSQHFVGETEAEWLKKQLERERSRVEFYQRAIESQKRSTSALKGQLTKTKNRIAKGICPCCNRQFSDLHRHMTTKHPDYSKTENQ